MKIVQSSTLYDEYFEAVFKRHLRSQLVERVMTFPASEQKNTLNQ